MNSLNDSFTDLCEVAQGHAASVIHEVGRVDASNVEIAQHADDAASVAAAGVKLARSTNDTCVELASRTEEIGQVIQLIDSVAGNTHLLALNATIEAARAGEAGKGFAVVASEVKGLATKTANATREVTEQITAIQATARKSIEAMENIIEVVTRVEKLQKSIAQEIQEQDEMTAAIQEQVNEVTNSIRQIAEHATEITTASGTGLI